MNSDEAKKLAIANKSKLDKKIQKTLKKIHSQIERKAKKGYSEMKWDYREIHDVDAIMSELKKEGYSSARSYPYLIIKW